MMYAWKWQTTASICVPMCVGSGLCTQLGFMHTQLYSCIHNSVLKALVTWEWACIRVVLSAYMGLDLRTWDVWQRPYFAHFHSFFDCFTPICNPNNSFLSFLHLNVTVSFFLSSFFYQNIIFFLNSTWIRNLMSSSSFCSHHSLMLVGEALTRW